MNKMERVRAALSGGPVDRPAYSFWTHFPDIDLDPGRVWSVTDPQFASGFASLVEDGPADALWRSCENGAGG